MSHWTERPHGIDSDHVPTLRDRIDSALDVAERYAMSQQKGTLHHRQWVIDQMVRALCGNAYEDWAEWMNADPDYGPWEEGIAP